MLRFVRGAAMAVLVGLLGACGGGSSGPAVPPVQLSADQAIFEAVNRTGGDYSLSWNVPFGGGQFVSGTNFIIAPYTSLMSASPSTGGAQRQDPLVLNLDPALALPRSTVTRLMTATGFQALSGSRMVSYQGAAVTVGFLPQSGGTAAVLSEQPSNFVSVPLTGFMGNSPEELLAEVPIQNWIKFNNFSATSQWRSGAAYVKRQRTRVGDALLAVDCASVANSPQTTTPTPNPCATGTTLATLFPISQYAGSYPYEYTDGTDGTLTTLLGLNAWVANAPVPGPTSVTPAYRVYFEYGGAVYAGLLQRSGTPINVRQTDGSAVDYVLTMNQAAIQSIEAGLITGSTVSGSGLGTTAEVPFLDLFGIGGHGVNGALAPADLRSHYDVPATLAGAGQTIAIVDAPGSGDPSDDLDVFSEYYGLPLCDLGNNCFTHIDLSGGASAPTSDDWGAEVALDTQMVHAMAPAAKIVLVTAASGQGSDLMAAVNLAAALPGVVAVSMSFGGSPSDNDSVAQDANFAAFQSNGMVFIASSGDTGSAGSAFAHYPAASPYVTAVGGTRILALGSAGAGSEVAWRFGGGGAAQGTGMPPWQSAYLDASLYSLNFGMRAVPDVAAVADNQRSAFAIYWRDGWRMGGGTSAAAPLWSGVVALFGEYLANKQASLGALVGGTAGGFNGLLYQARLLQGTKPAFVDIVSGSNDLAAGACALCAAQPGFDDATGLGTPDVAALFSYF